MPAVKGASIVFGILFGIVGIFPEGTATVRRATAADLAWIGLPSLYEALVAVANCPDLRIVDRAFAAAARQYGLRPADFTPYGRFAPDVAQLAEAEALRIHDNRQAFCSSARLTFAVVHGVLAAGAPR